MANRFSVSPLGGLDVGAKMTNIIQGGRQQNRLNQMREKAPAVFKTGDPTQIANFMIEYPEMATTMEKATGVQEEGQKREIVDVAKGLLTPGADPRQVIADYAISLKNSGRDPKMAISMLSKVMADPNQASQMGQKLLAIHSPDEFTAYQKATAPVGSSAMDVASIKEMEYLTQGLSPEEKQKAMRVKLGLDPRASEAAVDKALKAYSVEVAKLQAKFKLEPQVAGAVAAAKNEAASTAKEAGTVKSNEMAWNVYNNSMSNLSKAMRGTATGPVIGFIPAMTTNQQIAEGAVAVLAPVLKQMFRASGEGVFTDKDQELLMKMVPTRKDTPAARVAKIKGIDAVVRAKLGIDNEEAVTPPVATEELTPEQSKIAELEKIAFGGE